MEYYLKVSQQAETDVVNAVSYYDTINQSLGSRFITELYDSYLKIQSNPEYYSVISSNPADKYRDLKLRSFPYVIVFEIDGHIVYIAAVLCTHQRPFQKNDR